MNTEDVNLLGNIQWAKELSGLTGWKLRALARQGRIPGAFQLEKRVQGSPWKFHKRKFITWINQVTEAK